MKNTVLNLAVIVTAFVIGVSINNSCAKDDDVSDQINQAMVEIFYRDGLWFYPNGTVASKPKSESCTGSDVCFCPVDQGPYDLSLTYDDIGRLSSKTYDYAFGAKLKECYQYSGTMVICSRTAIDSDGVSYTGTKTTIYY